MKADELTIGEISELLWEYSQWLHKKGYIDSDFYCEEPYAVDEFMKDRLDIRIKIV
jgi:hypothetical protein